MIHYTSAPPFRQTLPAAAAALFLLFTLACSGGGGGSSPTAPTSTPPADIAGSWTGTATHDSSQGYCTDRLTPGFRHEVDLEITQNGADIDVRWTNRPGRGSLTCQFVGTVVGNSFTLTPDFGRSQAGCGPEQDYPCGRRLRRRVQNVQASRAEGTVSGDQIQIRATAAFEFYSKETGELLGEFTSDSTIEVTRVR